MNSSDCSDDDFIPDKKKILKIGLQSDDKKKRGRPKGSKNKTSAKAISKRKSSMPLATDVKDIINPDQQAPSTINALVPKIVLKINVSKGTVKGGDEISSTMAVQAHSLKQMRDEHVMSKFTDESTSNNLSLPGVPRTSAGFKRTLFYSSSDSDDSSRNENLATKLKRMKARSKLLKSFIPSESKGIPSPASCGDSCASSLGGSIEHALKAERLQKRFKSVKKSPKKRKKTKPKYYTLKPEIVEDNSARSSGSSLSSDEYNDWKRRTMTNPTDVVSKQIDLPDSSPEKGKRQPSPSPPTSPESKTLPKRHTRKDNAGEEDMWNAAVYLKWAPAKPTAVDQPQETKFKSVVEEFFRGYSPASLPSSVKPVPVRFPVVHEANCCVLWHERSVARGKQPAGRGRRKRKGVCTGYLACPCQNGAGPSSATIVLPSFHNVSPTSVAGLRPITHAQPPSTSVATGSATSMLDEDIIQLAKDALVADSKHRPQKVLAIMDISDDSDVDWGPSKVSASVKSPTPEREIVIKGEPPSSLSPKRRDSNASDSSDVEFVPGPPIEEIVVSDDSNDIIFVSETASPNKAAASTPKKEETSGLSTETADIIFDFVSNNTSPHASFLRRKLPVSPLVDSSSNDVLKAEAELVSNPICALPPPENFVTSFDITLESLYPAYSKNAGRASEPLDFDALLDFEAETMTTQTYEPYSPCLPEPPQDEYDRGDEIINIGSPERPAPEPIPEKTDGLVVWECPVCFEPKGDETILATTDCTHLFCDPCIRKVASMYGKCPVCQCAIKENNIHPFRFHGYKF